MYDKDVLPCIVSTVFFFSFGPVKSYFDQKFPSSCSSDEYMQELGLERCISRSNADSFIFFTIFKSFLQ